MVTLKEKIKMPTKQMLVIIMEMGFTVSWEDAYLVQTKIKFLVIVLDRKAVFKMGHLEACL